MKTQNSFFEQSGGTYTCVSDVLLPNLVIGEVEKKSIGKYGRMRKRYLKEQHPILYSELLLSGKLYPHLLEIDEACEERMELLTRQIAKQEKVANGKWDDDSTADKTVTLSGLEGDTLKLAANQIPTVGTKPNDTYKAGSWDVMPNTDTAITEATTYTYTYVAKEASVVTKAPEAKTLTYNGQAQELVTAGTATGGEMQYALGNATEVTQPYTTSIPAKTAAETYYVWYKVVGDETHKDSVPKCVVVTIKEAPNTPTPTEKHESEGTINCWIMVPTTMVLVVDIPIIQMGCFPSYCLSC